MIIFLFTLGILILITLVVQIVMKMKLVPPSRLAVVHGIMRTHQGSVGVQSTPGKGSVFTLYFPPAKSPAAVVQTEFSFTSKVQGNGKHVMYVDDDEALVFLVERVLTRNAGGG